MKKISQTIILSMTLAFSISTLDFPPENMNFSEDDSQECSIWDKLYSEHSKCLKELAVLQYLNSTKSSSSTDASSAALQQKLNALQNHSDQTKAQYEMKVSELNMQVQSVFAENQKLGEQTMHLQQELQLMSEKNAKLEKYRGMVNEQEIQLHAQIKALKEENEKLVVACHGEIGVREPGNEDIGSGFVDGFGELESEGN